MKLNTGTSLVVLAAMIMLVTATKTSRRKLQGGLRGKTSFVPGMMMGHFYAHDRFRGGHTMAEPFYAHDRFRGGHTMAGPFYAHDRFRGGHTMVGRFYAHDRFRGGHTMAGPFYAHDRFRGGHTMAGRFYAHDRFRGGHTVAGRPRMMPGDAQFYIATLHAKPGTYKNPEMEEKMEQELQQNKKTPLIQKTTRINATTTVEEQAEEEEGGIPLEAIEEVMHDMEGAEGNE